MNNSRLSTRLREIREAAGITAIRLSADSGIHPSRMSRIENGNSRPRLDELQSMIAAYDGIPDAVRALTRLRSMLHGGFYTELMHLANQPLEENETLHGWYADMDNEYDVRVYRSCNVIGLPMWLQTTSYVLALSRDPIIQIGSSPEAIRNKWVSETVARRIAAQARMLEEGKEFDFILLESALFNLPASPNVLTAQCNHLIQLSHIDNIRIRIIQLKTKLAHLPMTNWVIRDDKFVRTDTGFGSITITEPTAVADYLHAFEILSDAALDVHQSREVLYRHINSYVDEGDYATH